KEIQQNIRTISKKTAFIIEKIFKDILDDKHEEDVVDKKLIKRLDTRLVRTEKLIQYQKDEAKYHPLIATERDQFNRLQKQIGSLRLMHYHLDNLVQTPLRTITWTKEERAIVVKSVTELAESVKMGTQFNEINYTDRKEKLMQLFWEDNEEITKNNDQHPTYFPPELIILYELLTIYNLVARFYQSSD